jgi:hypothetical protein
MSQEKGGCRAEQEAIGAADALAADLAKRLCEWGNK